MKEDINKQLTGSLYQKIRIIDVFAVGPGLIYAGVSCEKINSLIRLFLIGTGIATIIFNGSNYMKIKKEQNVNKN